MDKKIETIVDGLIDISEKSPVKTIQALTTETEGIETVCDQYDGKIETTDVAKLPPLARRVFEMAHEIASISLATNKGWRSARNKNTALEVVIRDLKAALEDRTKEEIRALIEKYGDPQYKTSEFALYDVISVVQQLTAEVERLKADLIDVNETLFTNTNAYQSQKAENKALKAALEEIKNAPCDYTYKHCPKVAEQALKESEDSQCGI